MTELNQHDKKWFVYLGDRHEGPFSASEVENKMSHGQVTPQSYVWAEGMSDWQQMVAVGALKPLVEKSRVSNGKGTDEKTGDIDPKEAKRRAKAEKKAAKMAAKEARKAARAERPLIRRLAPWLLLFVIVAGIAIAQVTGKLKPLLEKPAVQAGIQTATDFAQPHLLKLSDKVPALQKWVSPIPRLDDVSPEDFEELKAAAMAPAEIPKVAIALSKKDLQTPTFHVASNLPNGAKFEIYVEGVPETLLNQMSFSAETKASIEKKLGQSGVVRFSENQALPRGDYFVYIVEANADSQTEDVKALLSQLPESSSARLPLRLPRSRKLLASKSYFLGGEKDATYASRLQEFHDKLKQKATVELNEVKMFAATLETQARDTYSNFIKLRKGAKPGKAQLKAWKEFHDKWLKLDGQMNQAFQKWTPATIQNDFFYGALYLLTQQAGQAIGKLHGYHHLYFASGVKDAKAYDTQVAQATALALTSLKTLKSKIEQAEKTPSYPNGRPRRDSL